MIDFFSKWKIYFHFIFPFQKKHHKVVNNKNNWNSFQFLLLVWCSMFHIWIYYNSSLQQKKQIYNIEFFHFKKTCDIWLSQCWSNILIFFSGNHPGMKKIDKQTNECCQTRLINGKMFVCLCVCKFVLSDTFHKPNQTKPIQIQSKSNEWKKHFSMWKINWIFFL